MPPSGKIAEIGSWKGKSSAYLGVEAKNANKSLRIWCVDTWKGCSAVPVQMKDSAVQTDTLYELFLSNIESLRDIITPIRGDSAASAHNFPDNYFDAVFIDASHEYENVKADIAAWYPKVKSGGIFAGHDYPGFPGVVQAVHEFLNANTVKDFRFSELCWICEKP